MKEFISNYNVGKDGLVFRKGSDKPMKPEVCKTGYRRITLCYKGKTKRFLLHRLIALVHIPNPDNLPVINHKDGDKSNNHVNNLEWSSYSDNNRHSYSVLNRDRMFGSKRTWSILTEDDIPVIRNLYSNGIDRKLIAKQFGVSPSTIMDVVNRRRWKHVK